MRWLAYRQTTYRTSLFAGSICMRPAQRETAVDCVGPVVERAHTPVDNEFVKHSLPVKTYRVSAEWNSVDINCDHVSSTYYRRNSVVARCSAADAAVVAACRRDPKLADTNYRFPVVNLSTCVDVRRYKAEETLIQRPVTGSNVCHHSGSFAVGHRLEIRDINKDKVYALKADTKSSMRLCQNNNSDIYSRPMFVYVV